MSTVKYLGHLPGGNPVQAHSAGDHYPYVITVVDAHDEADSALRWYEVSGPGLIHGLVFWTDREATSAARMLATCTASEDAWSFAIECAGRLGDVVLLAVRDYVRERVKGDLRFGEMTRGQRASALILWGHARALRGPRGPAAAGRAPSCEVLARAEVRSVDPYYAARREAA